MTNDLSRLKKQPYVTRRGNILHYRRRVPKGAEQAFGGKREFVRTLEASSLREAQSKLAKVIAEYERLASGHPLQTPSTLEPAVGDALAERLVRQHMRVVQKVNHSAIANVPARKAQAWARYYKRAALQERQALMRGELPKAWLMSARALVKEAGVDAAQHPQFVAQVARGIGELRAEYSMQLAYQLKGEPGRVANPSMFGEAAYASDARVVQLVTVADAATRFLSNPMREIAASTLQQYRPRMKVLREALGPSRAITEITRADCRRVVEDVILRLPANASKKYPKLTLQAAIEKGLAEKAPIISQKTQGLYIELLKTFFAWAERDDLIEASPARKVTAPKGREQKTRTAFSIDQLNKIFSAPLYTGCRDDEDGYSIPGPRKPRRHRFWIPLIALYSGMRVDEIAKLRRADLIRERGVDAFNLVEDHTAGRTLKTAGSVRQVPIHPQLVQIGLLEYAASLPTDAFLFPDLVASAKNPGDTFGKWFGRFCDSIGLKDRGLVFHSFRHTFATGCRECGIPREEFEAIGGWKYQGTSGVYGKQSLAALAKALSKLEYSGLSIAHMHGQNQRQQEAAR